LFKQVQGQALKPSRDLDLGHGVQGV